MSTILCNFYRHNPEKERKDREGRRGEKVFIRSRKATNVALVILVSPLLNVARTSRKIKFGCIAKSNSQFIALIQNLRISRTINSEILIAINSENNLISNLYCQISTFDYFIVI